MKDRDRLRRLAFRGGLVLGGMLLLLILAEGALRVVPQLFPRRVQRSLELGRHRMALKRVLMADPVLGIKIRPYSDLLIEGPLDLRYRVKTFMNLSDAGFRGNVEERPPVGVAVGDSFTFGTGVDAADAWPEQLSKLAGRNIANLGVPGLGPPQYTGLVASYGLTLRPKIILYALSQDDLDDSFCFGLWVQQRQRGEYRCPPETRPSSRIGRFLAARSALYRTFLAYSSPGESRRDEPEGQPPDAIRFEMDRIKGLLLPEALPAARGLTERAIRLARQTAKKAGAVLVLLLLPSKEQAYWHLISKQRTDITHDDIERLNRPVNELCREAGLQCLDLTPTFQEQAQKGRLLYFRMDRHMNAEGHRLAAQRIFEYLKKEKLL
jgi:lysophospholipase L1-like esterase